FAENPGILIQVKDRKAVDKILTDAGIGFLPIAKPTQERHLLIQLSACFLHDRRREDGIEQAARCFR
ncbi:hypothetical protein CLI75_12180, partial [Porphyromonas gingivalis]